MKYLTEEEFLDLYKFTAKKIMPEEFYKELSKVINRIEKVAFRKGELKGMDGAITLLAIKAAL